MPTTTLLEKAPTEIRTYAFDFSEVSEILAGQTLTGTPTVSGSPSGLTFGSPSISGSKVNVAISAGSDGTTYEITMTVTTSGSATLVGCGRLKVAAC